MPPDRHARDTHETAHLDATGAGLAADMPALAEREPGARVIAFDNLSRRGSELNLPRLKRAGVEFVHGDVRDKDDLMRLDPIHALVECSAEPSVMAGVDGSPDYVARTNLMGAYHCLELARRDNAQVVFLSLLALVALDRVLATRHRRPAPPALYILLEHLLSHGDYHRGGVTSWRERRRSMRPWQRGVSLPGAPRAHDGGDGLQEDREIQEDRPALEI